MDIGTAIIGVVSAAVCALPFVLTSTNRTQKEKRSLNILRQLAEKNKSEISKFDIGSIYAIGVNELHKSLCYILEVDGFYKEEFINLNMVKTCKASTITRTTSGNNKIIDRLFLTFNFKDKSKSDLILEFYNVDIKYQLNDEVKKIEKWHKLIVGLLEN